MMLMDLSTIENDQDQAVNKTINNVEQFLNYLASNPNATMRYHALDMILNIHSDASYLLKQIYKSITSITFFLVWIPRDSELININSAVYTLCTIIKFMALSVAEADLGLIYPNKKEAHIMRLNLVELGHPHPPTPIHFDNTTSVGIVNETNKKQ